MVGAPSFSQHYLFIQPPLQSPPITRSSTSVNLHLSIPPLLFNKNNLIIPTNTLFLYAWPIFHFPISTYNHPSNLRQKYFLYFIHLVNSGSVKGPSSYGVLRWITMFQPLPSSSKYRQCKQGSQSLISYRSVSQNSSLWWRCLQLE